MAPAAKRKRSIKFQGTGPQGRKLADLDQTGDDNSASSAGLLKREFDDGNDSEEEVHEQKVSKKQSKRSVTAKQPKASAAPSKRGKNTKKDMEEVPNTKKSSITKKGSSNKSNVGEGEDGAVPEKRLRRFRASPPSSYLTIASRALSQRLCVLERRRTGTEAAPEETVELAGTTGNIYTVRINKLPSCNCPHARKGNQCKHIVYVMKRTLRAREDFVYQLALLSSELSEIFANAPPIPTDKGEADAKGKSSKEDPNRKPVADDCPICCVDFDPENDDIVWCEAACGNNVHRDCLETWANMKKAQHAKVTCPFCRTEWRDDKLSKSVSAASAVTGPDGYRNVAAQLGLSGLRDYSTYHPFWVERQRRLGGGVIANEDLRYYESDLGDDDDDGE